MRSIEEIKNWLSKFCNEYRSRKGLSYGGIYGVEDLFVDTIYPILDHLEWIENCIDTISKVGTISEAQEKILKAGQKLYDAIHPNRETPEMSLNAKVARALEKEVEYFKTFGYRMQEKNDIGWSDIPDYPGDDKLAFEALKEYCKIVFWQIAKDSDGSYFCRIGAKGVKGNVLSCVICEAIAKHFEGSH